MSQTVYNWRKPSSTTREPNRLILTPPERKELHRRVRSRNMRAEDSKRVRVILEVVSGRGNAINHRWEWRRIRAC